MEDIDRFLSSRGFVPNRPIYLDATPTFSGYICIGDWRLKLELRFREGRFDYPDAYLPEWPFDLNLRSSFGYRHINDDGKVCFVDQSRTWWDSAMATELVAGCLERIERVLVDNLANAPAEEVIAQDFSGYWSAHRSLHVACVVQNKDDLIQIIEQASGRQWLVRKAEDSWLSIDAKQSPNTPWVILRLAKPPVSLNPKSWPPTSIREVIDWIRQSAPDAHNQLVQRLRQSIQPKGKGNRGNDIRLVGVALIWPSANEDDALGCGFTFVIPDVAAKAIEHKRLKQAAKILKADGTKIIRYRLNRADPSYIQTRNRPKEEPSLKNRRVILVGAGTIGGHLGKLLCSHGAGWGANGELHIIDSDDFSIENVGRHLLGTESVGHSKAEAVAARLRLDFPFLKIQEHPCSLNECWNIFTQDCIIVDATGSQTVAIAIPDYLSEHGMKPVVVHSWIHGHGLATVALLNDRNKKGSACYRCLWLLENGKYRSRFPLSRFPEDDPPLFAACHQSFHAYAATTSMIAATQAMTVLYDYLADRVQNSLRFQVLKPDLCQKRPDTTPQPDKNCPLCSRPQ